MEMSYQTFATNELGKRNYSNGVCQSREDVLRTGEDPDPVVEVDDGLESFLMVKRWEGTHSNDDR